MTGMNHISFQKIFRTDSDRAKNHKIYEWKISSDVCMKKRERRRKWDFERWSHYYDHQPNNNLKGNFSSLYAMPRTALRLQKLEIIINFLGIL